MHCKIIQLDQTATSVRQILFWHAKGKYIATSYSPGCRKLSQIGSNKEFLEFWAKSTISNEIISHFDGYAFYLAVANSQTKI